MDAKKNKGDSSSFDKDNDGNYNILKDNRYGSSPNPPRHPLEILPAELWSMVFSHLKDANDMANASRASAVWDGILEPEKCRFLFPQILPVIASKHLSQFTITPKQPPSDIRNLRFVCKAWKSSVDNYIQHHPCHFEQSPTEHCLKRNSRVVFNRATHVYNFYKSLKNYTGSNPFLSRHLFVSDYHPWEINESDQIWFGLKKLLRRWGSEIWYFGVEIYSEHKPARIYRNIRKCLCLMPNLKVLELQTLKLLCRLPREIEYFGRIIVDGRFPRLEKLELFIGCLLPTPLLNEALINFSNIRKLVLLPTTHRALPEGHYEYDSRHIQLRNLKELTLSLHTRRDLISLGNVSWPLVETLTLVMMRCKETEDVNVEDHWLDISNVFTVLNHENHFGKKLKNLNIHLCGATRLKMPIIYCNFTLNMPCLEKFQLYLKSVCMNGFDFVRNFQNLKELRVTMENYLVVPNENFSQIRMENEQKGEINFFSCVKGINYCESNLWEDLQKLESLVMNLQPRLPGPVRVPLKLETFQLSRNQYLKQKS